ncbi:hypothetical protein [Streptomyces sp. NPDC058861]|uniref:hypothetical protein n=1 Tax=Streptomyces sp. NPDC058861 TaxID=3346653 RepID=UPI0036A23037
MDEQNGITASAPPIRCVIETWSNEDGIRCALGVTPDAVNGYVRVPEDHPIPLDVIDRYVHAYGTLNWGLSGDKGRWVGFDTMHPGDVWDPQVLRELLERHGDAEGAVEPSLKELRDRLMPGWKDRELEERRWDVAQVRCEVEILAWRVAQTMRPVPQGTVRCLLNLGRAAGQWRDFPVGAVPKVVEVTVPDTGRTLMYAELDDGDGPDALGWVRRYYAGERPQAG